MTSDQEQQPRDRIVRAVVALTLALIAVLCMLVPVRVEDASALNGFALLLGALAVGFSLGALTGNVTSASKGIAAAALILGLLFGGMGGILLAQDQSVTQR